MAYKYDPLKYKNTFDGMFGAGEFDKGIGRAREIGKSIGEAKLERELRELQRKLEEEKKKEEEEKKKDEKSKKSKENDNLKRRIEASGGDTEKKQSAFGKAANLDPDNNIDFIFLKRIAIKRPSHVFQININEHLPGLVLGEFIHNKFFLFFAFFSFILKLLNENLICAVRSSVKLLLEHVTDFFKLSFKL